MTEACINKEFSEWLDGVLAQGLPDDAAAVNFNIYEDGRRYWSIQLIAASYFDEEDEDWACDEVFTTGENLFRWRQNAEWSEILETAEGFITDYLANGRYSEMLKRYEAVACGFVNGDIQILYSKKRIEKAVMKLPKYMRIQGRETAYRTGKPVGIFVLNWRRIRDGVYSSEDAKIYEETHQWFLDNLPEPPFYGNDNENPQGAVTWFKTESSAEMLEHIQPLIDLLEKYDIPYDIVYSNYVGKIIYEDEYQVGVIDGN